MVNLTEEHKEFIRKNLDNPEKLIKTDDVNEVLDALDELMMLEGFDKDDEPNKRGYEIEKVLDEIYMNN